MLLFVEDQMRISFYSAEIAKQLINSKADIARVENGRVLYC